MQTIYADVLVILNTYVNFALLRLTALIDKSKVKRLRIFLGALLG
ncbi:MAG: sigma-E processing peptidase SpoIIGA, partial [Acutalibacteraceae bacterium]